MVAEALVSGVARTEPRELLRQGVSMPKDDQGGT